MWSTIEVDEKQYSIETAALGENPCELCGVRAKCESIALCCATPTNDNGMMCGGISTGMTYLKLVE